MLPSDDGHLPAAPVAWPGRQTGAEPGDLGARGAPWGRGATEKARGHRRMESRRRTPSPFRRLAEVQVLHAAGDGMVAVPSPTLSSSPSPSGRTATRSACTWRSPWRPAPGAVPARGALARPTLGHLQVRRRPRHGGRHALLAVLLATRTDRVALYSLAFGLLVLSRIHGISRRALMPDVLPPDRSPMWGTPDWPCFPWWGEVSGRGWRQGPTWSAAGTGLGSRRRGVLRRGRARGPPAP